MMKDEKSKISTKKILIILFILFLGLRLISFTRSYSRDEAGWVWALTEGFTLQNWNFHPPLGFTIYSIGFWFTGIDYLRLVPIFFSLICFFLVYLLAKELFDKKTALFSSLLYSITYYAVIMSQHIDTDPAIQAMFHLAALLLTVLYVKTGKKWYLLGCGAAIGFLTLTRISSFIIAVPIIFYLYYKSRKIKETLNNTILLAIPAIMLVGTWIALDHFLAHGQGLTATIQWNGGRGLDVFGQTLSSFIYDKMIYAYLIARKMTPGFIVLLFTSIFLFFKTKKHFSDYALLVGWIAVFAFAYLVVPGGDKVRYLSVLVPGLCIIIGSFIKEINLKQVGLTALAAIIILAIGKFNEWGSNSFQVNTSQIISSFIEVWAICIAIYFIWIMLDKTSKLKIITSVSIGLILGFTLFYMFAGSELVQRSVMVQEISKILPQGNTLVYNDFGVCVYDELRGNKCSAIDEYNATNLNLVTYLNNGNWPKKTIEKGLIYYEPSLYLNHNLTTYIQTNSFKNVVLTKKEYASEVTLPSSCILTNSIESNGDQMAQIYKCN